MDSRKPVLQLHSHLDSYKGQSSCSQWNCSYITVSKGACMYRTQMLSYPPWKTISSEKRGKDEAGSRWKQGAATALLLMSAFSSDPAWWNSTATFKIRNSMYNFQPFSCFFPTHKYISRRIYAWSLAITTWKGEKRSGIPDIIVPCKSSVLPARRV